MIRSRLALILSLTLLCVGIAPFILTTQSANLATQRTPQNESAREQAYRANNLGVALLEQFNFKDGAAQFRRALQIDPKLAIAQINLCIALYNEPELDAALREAKTAATVAPDAPQPHYMLGLIARVQNRTADAVTEFRRVLQIDAADVGANINLSQIYMQQRNYPEALPPARTAYEAEPYNSTAAYTLANALNRSGQMDEGRKMTERFQSLRQSNYATKIDKDYLEQGKYAEALASTGAESGLVDTNVPEVSFSDATQAIVQSTASTGTKPTAGAGQSSVRFNRQVTAAQLNDAGKKEIASAFSGCAVLFDYDGDGDLDLYETGPRGAHLYRNDKGKLVDVTAQSGALATSGELVTAVVAGDYDNDSKPDLFVLRYGSISLYHNNGNGSFSDVTSSAGIPAYPYLAISAAFVDVDHDGDLDIFIAGFADLTKAPAGEAGRAFSFPTDFNGAPNLLLRNDGNGKFTDITVQAKVGGALGHAVAVVPTDFDNRRDIDLLVLNFNGPPVLLRNMRDGSFSDVAAAVGLGASGRYTSAAACDVNKDGYTDFYFGVMDGPGVFVLSDGKGRFAMQPVPEQSGSEKAGTTAAQFVDYDNDGLFDLVSVSEGTRPLRVLRNLGNRWSDVSEKAVPSVAGLATRVLASGDIDGDGDTDLVVRSASGEIQVLRNQGGSVNRSLRVQLSGKVSNRNGVGSKIEVRAGSLKQRIETSSASPPAAPSDVVFGLGRHQSVDAVRVLWPSGIVQAETEIPKSADTVTAQALTITELDRKPSSCPYLYAWNGTRFEFITDFMGGGEMGYWEAPGQRNHPDPDEYVRMTSDQLKARNGRYELRVTNELEEALYVDRLQLAVVSHPASVEVYPNEGMSEPPREYKLFVVRNPQPPLTATDDHGHDVLARIAKLDRQYPDDFRLHRIRGYSEQHTLTMALGATTSQRVVLLLTGWTDYAFSSDNLGASQSGMSMQPPSLQVKDPHGAWKTVIEDIGIPVGRPQTVTVDLTGKFLSASREVRLVTNMRIYWDRILVDTSDGETPIDVQRIDPSTAELHWRGFSAEVTPDGREPFSYDYDRVTAVSPWKTMPGRYTREGDVKELLLRSDDMFVISRPGDEISLSFDATKLPPLPAGWTRTFLLYADGFSKEMDINSASPDQVLPLPFHGMKSYPYTAPEGYPLTPERRRYIERYNTRRVVTEVPPIECASEQAAGAAARGGR